MASTYQGNAAIRPHALSLPDRVKSHRHLLANLDTYVGSSSERDDTTDDESTEHRVFGNDEDADHVVGVSMGKEQTRLKSPKTPAVDKARALESSGQYFTFEFPTSQPITHATNSKDSEEYEPAIETEIFPTITTTLASQDDPAALWKTSTSTPKPSLLKVFGGSGQSGARKRASSGPGAILNSLKKMLPDFPSPLASRFSPTSPPQTFAMQPNKMPKNEPHAPFNLSRQQDGVSSPPLYEVATKDDHSPDQIESIQEVNDQTFVTDADEDLQGPKMLRRTTSDNSLYLRKATTGGSNFDDTTIYSDVADMPNARFKAITDSLQDSAIRLPKLSVLRGSGRLSLSHSENNTTKANTEANRTIALPIDNQFGKDSKPSGVSGHPTPKTTKHPMLKEALSRASGDMVVLGGYRGSILRSAEPPHQQVWIPVKVGLNLRKVDLEVGLTQEDEEQMTKKIIPSGILSHIGPIDISRRLLKKIQRCPNVNSERLRLHDWGYDWRLSPHLLAGQLIKFLESLECNKPNTPPESRGALVIAHSLGGLITRHAVNQRPELFSGVVYAGVPQNCVNILGPLRNGDDVLISSRVLTAQVNFTLRTSYALLPENGRCFINKDTGERYDVDFFDINTWEEHRLSPCINPPLMPIPGVKRKSIVGSISDSISSFAPSLPNKKNSWFGTSNDSTSSTGINSSVTSAQPQEAIKEVATKSKDEISHKLKTAANSVEQAANSPLEPSMKNTSLSSAHHHHNNLNHQELSKTTSSSSSAATAATTVSSGSSTQSIATTVTIPKASATEYLTRTLKQIKQFKSELEHNVQHQSSNAYPPFAIIYSRSVPTVYGAKVASREAIKYADAYDDLVFASGDGVVLASAAQLPMGYRCVRGGRVKSERGHVGLLGDLEGIGKCIGAVLEGRRKGIGMGMGRGKGTELQSSRNEEVLLSSSNNTKSEGEGREQEQQQEPTLDD